MWKLLTLLCAGMFLTLLIGGEDRGQQRMGLRGVDPAAEPVVVAAAPVAAPEPAPQRVALRAPDPAPVPEPVVSEAPPALAERPVFSLTSFAPVQPDRQPPAPPLPAEPVAVAVPEPAADPVPAALPLRWVRSASINVRGGPSTNDAVIGNLKRGEAVAVVAEVADGWLLVRIEGDGVEGYVAARLLTDQDPG